MNESGLRIVKPPQLSWVLPLYRTAEQLPELLSRIHRVAAELAISHEVVLVDDACPGGTGALADTIAAGDPSLRVLRLTENGGQDAALRAGLRLCRGQWVIILDADLQDPPEAVLQIWPLRDFVDACFVERTGAYTNPVRRATSRLYRLAAQRIGGLPRGACLFALLSRPLVDRINQVPIERKISLLALLSAFGRRFASVPVQRSPRAIGVSGYSSLARCAKAARSLWQLFFMRRLHRLPALLPPAGAP